MPAFQYGQRKHSNSHSQEIGEASRSSSRMSAGSQLAHLHQTWGNRVVSRMLAPSSAGNAPALQTKMTVGRAGDAFKQKADRVGKVVADHISGMSNGAKPVQRRSEDEEELSEGVQRRVGKEMEPWITGMNFDTALQEAGYNDAPLPSTTYYARNPEEQAAFARSFQGGKMMGADGKAVDTKDSLTIDLIYEEEDRRAQESRMESSLPPKYGVKTSDEREKEARLKEQYGRQIYAMDMNGQFYTADAVGENRRRGEEAKAAGLDRQERIHHSTFTAGQEVAGAGEMQIRDGQVEIFSDSSGHYHPGSKQMYQTAEELHRQKAGIEKIGAEFVAKDIEDKEGNNVPAVGKLRTTALEILGYEGQEEYAEAEIRKAHAAKDAMLGDLMQAVKQREERLKKREEEQQKPV